MTSDSHGHTAQLRAKPVMLFDGDCHFCRRWVERWRGMTDGRVDFVTSQEAGARFPAIEPAAFERAVQFVDFDGNISSGADAVFRSLRYARNAGWLAWSYEHVPGFAPVTELAYSLVAKNRSFASAATRLFWGEDVRQPSYFQSRRIFLRLLGLTYLIAFVSLWIQIDGLVGSDGISPVGDYLSFAREQVGARAPFLLPTLCWLNSSDTFLHLLCGTGAGFSLLLLLGLVPPLSLAVLYVCYLSLTIAGQTFLSFQWDILLLETGFLAIFFVPWSWRMRRADEAPFSPIGLFLLKLLLFKLMLMSGVVKLTSGDAAWWNLTALNYHYETQPLPTVLGWWAHQTPDWFKQISTAFVLLVEVVAPFLIWMPRRLRLAGCALLVTLQVLIALTGNYAFFNLLTVALCLLLVDDASWSKLLRRVPRDPLERDPRNRVSPPLRAVAALVCIMLLPGNAWLIYSAFKAEADPPKLLAALDGAVEPFRVANGYGLFRVMTKTRPEIQVEGSADGIVWLPYTFRWKPGAPNAAPRWVAPHQPRLDWQMWFAALGGPRQNHWFVGMMEGLLRNRTDVLRLLAENPFRQTPPRYVRAILYRYRFSTPKERRETGNWWMREEMREYLRSVSLE